MLKFKNKFFSNKKVYIESYGCQMNFSDSEIVSSILLNEGFDHTKNAENADLILINTCSIREKAEDNIRNRLSYFNSLKKINNDIKIGVFFRAKLLMVFFSIILPDKIPSAPSDSLQKLPNS